MAAKRSDAAARGRSLWTHLDKPGSRELLLARGVASPVFGQADFVSAFRVLLLRLDPKREPVFAMQP